MDSLDKLIIRNSTTGSLLCVGLDSEYSKLPDHFKTLKNPQFEFNRWIIDRTHSVTLAYKPNLAFYEARGEHGWHDLQLTMEYLHSNYSDILTIADAKRADIGNTNQGYVRAIFDELRFDAITLHPYLGKEALQPFLERKDKLSIILCKTSNPGSGELQDLEVHGQPLWQFLAEKVIHDWNDSNNCMLVVGATYPVVLKKIRAASDSLWILVPGIGAQGGDLSAVLRAGLNAQGTGLLLNSSREIIFAQNPALAAKELHEKILSSLSRAPGK